MEVCLVCKKGFCPSRARRTFGKLPRGICSPTCRTTNDIDETELLAEKICIALLQAGHIDDYDCDTVKVITPLLKPD